MTVYRRGDVWYYDFWLDRKRYGPKRIGPVTRRQAEDAEALVRARALETRLEGEFGLTAPARALPTIDVFCEHTLLPALKNNLAGKGYPNAKSALKRIRRALGVYRPDQLTARILEDYKTARLAEVSVNFVREDFRWIRRIVREAGVRKSPAFTMKLPKRQPPPDRILSDDEETALFNKGIRDETLRNIISVDLVTGWRREGICSVTGARVDLDELRATIRMKGGRYLTLPILEDAAAVLRPLKELHGNGPLFVNRHGRPVKDQAVGNSLRRALARAGIKGFRFHDLRHTFATRLARNGFTQADVGALLGHQPPYVETARYFAHTSEARMREALQSLSRRKSLPRRRTRPR